MAERDVTRNSRGQIISYEILGESDSTAETPTYGVVELATTEPLTGFKHGPSERYEVGIYRDGKQSYDTLVDREISDELRETFIQPELELDMGQRLDVFDFIGFFEPPPRTLTPDGSTFTDELPTATNPESKPENFTPFGVRRNVDANGISSVTNIVKNTTDSLYYEWNTNQNTWNIISPSDPIYLEPGDDDEGDG